VRHALFTAVAGDTTPEPESLGTAPGRPGATRPLPQAHLNALAGLLDKLAEDGGEADLHRIGAELALEIDARLPSQRPQACWAF
jgi:hypothetical protein